MDQPAVSSGPPSVTAVVAFSKGFACACGYSVVHLFEKGDDKECYRKTREIQACALYIGLLRSWLQILKKNCDLLFHFWLKAHAAVSKQVSSYSNLYSILQATSALNALFQ